MKSLIAVASFIVFTAGTQVCGCGSCKVNAQSPAQSAYTVAKEEPKTATFKITGMTCAGCAGHVHAALKKTPGVLSKEVKYPGDIAIVKYDASKISEEQIIKAIETTGYKATAVCCESHATKGTCSSDCQKPCCTEKKKKA